ncbi:GNAT family N-acetyltransferase [Rhizobium sp. C1]|uniref:GNAT family N-acetyltransferase n=1 Tax=Rhizobium sp. C1 TaxID=1349799 RepID=UPI001E5891EA|nr:GNAT family N-acetyltransferase [Rhizobium sp. C1]MCD2177520.1 GNAT family N-acetyltransferase [Rhizobium sp. C1]
MGFTIKAAGIPDFKRIQEIELAAFETLRSAGAVSGKAEASSDEELFRYLEDNLLLAAFDAGGELLGYAGAYAAGTDLHIGEMDVDPRFQRRGVGRSLISAFLAEGGRRKLRAVTLTTDRFAPFNAPFYASMGFQLLEGSEIPERLKAILDGEVGRGFDPARRVAMIFPLAQ